jgi:hypothetical protein
MARAFMQRRSHMPRAASSAKVEGASIDLIEENPDLVRDLAGAQAALDEADLVGLHSRPGAHPARRGAWTHPWTRPGEGPPAEVPLPVGSALSARQLLA